MPLLLEMLLSCQYLILIFYQTWQDIITSIFFFPSLLKFFLCVFIVSIENCNIQREDLKRVALISIKDVILYFVRDILNILAYCNRPKLIYFV